MTRILMVSLGSIGRRHLRNTRELLPDAEIAVYRTHFYAESQLPDGADRILFELGDAVAFRPDAVVISSPASDHLRHARAFIDAGAHLFIEKPLAASLEGVDELVSVCEASDRFAMVGYVLRFQPILNFIRNTLRSDRLGEIRTANVQVGQYLPDWRPDSDYREGVSAQRKLGGGALLELSHEIDYAAWLFGLPDHLLCSSGRVSDLEIDVEDSACVVMEYGDTELARRVVVQVDFLQRVANMAVQVVGSRATLYADLIRERAWVVEPGSAQPNDLDAPVMAEGNEMYLRQFDFFFSRCFDDYRPRFPETDRFDAYVDVAQAARVLRIVELAKQANRDGSRVRVDP